MVAGGGCKSKGCMMKVTGVMVAQVKIAAVVVE
jgi:hypothetical protein